MTTLSRSPAATPFRLRPPRRTGYTPDLAGTWLFMTRAEWGVTLFAAGFVALLTWPEYQDLSLWIGMGVFLAVVAIVNAAFASRYCVPYPQIAVIVACLQLVLAAWVSWYYPLHHDVFDIGDRISEYMGYAGPVCLAFSLGIGLPLAISAGRVDSRAADSVLARRRAALGRELDWLFYIGLAAKVLRPAVSGQLDFFLTLVKALAYVGVFGRLLLGLPGWRPRAAAVFGIELIYSVWTGVFHELLLWTTYLVFIYAYKKQWGRKALPIILAGFLGVVLLHQWKTQYRAAIFRDFRTTVLGRLSVFLGCAVDTVLDPAAIVGVENLSQTAMRLNQGWIVNRVMVWVPEKEPFCRGETIGRQLVACLLPRFLAPEKYRAGGQEYFERFTGHQLFGASMGLGYAGEMYVNYGPLGGVFAVAVYGLALGLGYRWVLVRALRSPLWWAWGAYIAIVAVKAEDSIGYVLNWVTKASLVAAGVILLCPAMRRVLLPPSAPARRPMPAAVPRRPSANAEPSRATAP